MFFTYKLILYISLLAAVVFGSHEITSDTPDLDRFLREIYVDNSSNLTALQNLTNGLNLTVNSTKDEEADSFIEDLRKLSTNQTETDAPSLIISSEMRGNISAPLNTLSQTNASNISSDDGELMKHPNLLYISKLNGSSFRIKILINQSWDEDLKYPNTIKYARTESAITSGISATYKNYESFINFHMISFNSLNETSYFCNFLLNFNKEGQHLQLFLRLILKKNINDIPVSYDDVDVYAIMANQNINESCPSGCVGKNCTSKFCPLECCNQTNITDDTSAVNQTKTEDIIQPQPSINIGNHSTVNFESFDWPYNSSVIHQEIMDIIKAASLNATEREPARVKTYEDLSEKPIVSPEQSNIFMPTGSDISFKPHNYYPSPYNNNQYLEANIDNTAMNQDNTETNAILTKPAEFYSSKRTNVPTRTYNGHINPKPTTMFRPERNRPQIPTIPSNNFMGNFRVYYPDLKKTQLRTYVPTAQQNRKIVSPTGGLKVWYPKIK